MCTWPKSTARSGSASRREGGARPDPSPGLRPRQRRIHHGRQVHRGPRPGPHRPGGRRDERLGTHGAVRCAPPPAGAAPGPKGREGPLSGSRIWAGAGRVTLEYVVRRFALLVVVLLLAVTVNFIIPRLTPGDPIEQKLSQLVATSGGQVGDITAMVQAYRARFGLDQPLLRQYVNYWVALMHLDLGFSLDNFPERVADAIAPAPPRAGGLLGLRSEERRVGK